MSSHLKPTRQLEPSPIESAFKPKATSPNASPGAQQVQQQPQQNQLANYFDFADVSNILGQGPSPADTDTQLSDLYGTNYFVGYPGGDYAQSSGQIDPALLQQYLFSQQQSSVQANEDRYGQLLGLGEQQIGLSQAAFGLGERAIRDTFRQFGETAQQDLVNRGLSGTSAGLAGGIERSAALGGALSNLYLQGIQNLQGSIGGLQGIIERRTDLGPDIDNLAQIYGQYGLGQGLTGQQQGNYAYGPNSAVSPIGSSNLSDSTYSGSYYGGSSGTGYYGDYSGAGNAGSLYFNNSNYQNWQDPYQPIIYPDSGTQTPTATNTGTAAGGDPYVSFGGTSELYDPWAGVDLSGDLNPVGA